MCKWRRIQLLKEISVWNKAYTSVIVYTYLLYIQDGLFKFLYYYSNVLLIRPLLGPTKSALNKELVFKDKPNCTKSISRTKIMCISMPVTVKRHTFIADWKLYIYCNCLMCRFQVLKNFSMFWRPRWRVYS